MSESEAAPRVAVIIPTYNHARFLASAIESVLAQTVHVDEIIVVDDGSRDRPEETTAPYPQVHLIRQENRGLSAARNAGLRASTAPLLVFLDADDRLLPTAIAHNLELLSRDAEAGFAYGGYADVDAASGKISPAEFYPVPRQAFGAFLRGNQIGMHAAVMYRREVVEAVGGFREGLPACEDYDIYLRLAMHFPVVCQPEMIAEYWHHDRNMSRDSAFMLHHVLAVLGNLREKAEQHGLIRDYQTGIAGYRRYYSSCWMEAARRTLNARKLNAPFAWQGLKMLRLAPVAMMRSLARALMRRARL